MKSTPEQIERSKARQLALKQTPEGHLKILLGLRKCVAKKKGIPFNVSVKDFDIPTHCPLTGAKLDWCASKGSKGPRQCSPSVDRKDISRGYVPGNVWIISTRANTIKNNARSDEILEIGRRLKEMGL